MKEVTITDLASARVRFTGDPHDSDWATKAKCNSGTDMMYPDTAGAQRAVAKYLCNAFKAQCPVQLPCLLEALESNDEFGVRGGLTVSERRKLQSSFGAKLLSLVAAERTEHIAEVLDRNNRPEQYTTVKIPDEPMLSAS